MENDRTEALKKIRDEVLSLKDSPLYQYRLSNNFFPVIGKGNHYAKIVLIGEAPGLQEAKCGHPFVGKSGKVLDSLLSEVNLSREEIYITNIVKDRPPNNRNPKPEEIEVYKPFLNRQLNIIKPMVIATLGKFAMDYIGQFFNLTDRLSKITQCHGKVFKTDSEWGEINIIPLYHPAVATYSPNMLKVLEEDFEKIIQI